MAVAVGVTENASAEPPRAVPVTHQALAVSPASSTLGGQVVPVAPSIVATARPAPRGSGARAHEAVVVRDSLAGACYLLRDQDTQTDLPPQMRVVQSAGDTVHLESAVPMLVAREAWLVERGDVWRGVLVQPRTGPAQRADPVAARAVVGVRVPCSTR